LALKFKTFSANLAFIDAHNKKNLSFTVALNEFADLTGEEFNQLYNGLKVPQTYVHANPSFPNDKVVAPGAQDWRAKGAVTGIKNQGQCGSCWSFSTTGSTEGCHEIKSGNLVSLSEQNLMDCSTSYGNNACNGGLMTQAMQYIIANGGIIPKQAIHIPLKINQLANTPQQTEEQDSNNFPTLPLDQNLDSNKQEHLDQSQLPLMHLTHHSNSTALEFTLNQHAHQLNWITEF